MKPAEGRDPRLANTVVWHGSKLNSAGDRNHTIYTHVGAGSTSDALGRAHRQDIIFVNLVIVG